MSKTAEERMKDPAYIKLKKLRKIQQQVSQLVDPMQDKFVPNEQASLIIREKEDQKEGFLTREEFMHRILSHSAKSTWNYDRDDRRYAIDKYITKSGTRILDLGCGTAEIYDRIAETGKPTIYYGVDRSTTRIKQDQSKIDTQSARSMFFNLDITDGQFETILSKKLKLKTLDRFFDTVIANQVLEHLDAQTILPLLTRTFGWAKRNFMLTVPNVDSLPLLSYYHLAPEQMLMPGHNLFFTPALMQNLLTQAVNQSGRSAKIYVDKFLRYFTAGNYVGYYHIFAEVQFNKD